MTDFRIFLLALAGFAAQLMVSPAEAQQHHRPHVQALDPGCNVIFPCTPMAGQRLSGGNPFAGARAIRITMHRTRKAHRRPPVARQGVDQHHATKLQDRVVQDGRGVVKSTSGAVAYVAAGARGAFQCLVSSLDDAGYRIAEMGGFADHGHIRHSKHYSGRALDINQVERNVVSRPFPVNVTAMARSCGLESGATWRWADAGHFEVPGPTTRHASARRRPGTRYAGRHRRTVDRRFAGAG